VLSCPPAFAGVNNRALRYAQIGPFSASTDIITEPRQPVQTCGTGPVTGATWLVVGRQQKNLDSDQNP